MTSKRRIAVGASACAVVAGAIVATQVDFGTSSASDPKTSSVSSARGHDRGAHRHGRNGGKHGKDPFGPAPATSGGKMLGPGSGFISGTIMSPDNGGWTVTSHTQDTVVEAGGDAAHPSNGLFSIIRSSYLTGQQSIDLVRVAGSGPLTITKAPLGPKVVVSAQKPGNIEFKSERGITGTLHLKDDTVTLNP
jgi:hypothetical protein